MLQCIARTTFVTMKFSKAVVASALTASATAATLTVDQTVLVLARSTDEGKNAALAFNAHGIPYQTSNNVT